MSRILKFGVYEVDPRAGELRKYGLRQRLAGQPMQLLLALLERPQELVTREELQRRIWPGNISLDFDLALKKAVNRARAALGDSATSPRFIETVPRRGYRFLVPVIPVVPSVPVNARARDDAPAGQSLAAINLNPTPVPPTRSASLLKSMRKMVRLRHFAIVAAIGWAAFLVLLAKGHPVLTATQRESVLVADFENHTGDWQFDDALREPFTVAIEQSSAVSIVPKSWLAPQLEKLGLPKGARITADVGRKLCQQGNVDVLITGEITRTGQEFAVSAELVDPRTSATIRSYSERAHGEDQVLAALDRVAVKLRSELGESMEKISRSDSGH